MRVRRQARRVAARACVFVDVGLYDHFHKRWGEIDREWRAPLTVGEVQSAPGMFEAVAMGIEAARASLRDEVRSLARQFPGSYLVPI